METLYCAKTGERIKGEWRVIKKHKMWYGKYHYRYTPSWQLTDNSVQEESLETYYYTISEHEYQRVYAWWRVLLPYIIMFALCLWIWVTYMNHYWDVCQPFLENEHYREHTLLDIEETKWFLFKCLAFFYLFFSLIYYFTIGKFDPKDIAICGDHELFEYMRCHHPKVNRRIRPLLMKGEYGRARAMASWWVRNI